MFPTAAFAFDRRVRLADGADGFKNFVAVFTNVFVDWHKHLTDNAE